MKFYDYKVKLDRHGFKYIKDDIIVGKEKGECTICHNPTVYIDIYSMGYFCCDECLNKFYKDYDKKTKEMMNIKNDF